MVQYDNLGALLYEGRTSSSGTSETWVIDKATGIKTYTSGPRTGETEDVSERFFTYGGGGYSERSGNTDAEPVASPLEDEENNTLLWIGLFATLGMCAYKFFKGRKPKRKRR